MSTGIQRAASARKIKKNKNHGNEVASSTRDPCGVEADGRTSQGYPPWKYVREQKESENANPEVEAHHAEEKNIQIQRANQRKARRGRARGGNGDQKQDARENAAGGRTPRRVERVTPGPRCAPRCRPTDFNTTLADSKQPLPNVAAGRRRDNAQRNPRIKSADSLCCEGATLCYPPPAEGELGGSRRARECSAD
jgi:hypothetical protein